LQGDRVCAHHAILITRARATTDDSRAHEDLGFVPRDLRETLADTVRSLVASGWLSPGQAGALGSVSSVSDKGRLRARRSTK
jgi:hypothetical protein